MIAFSIFKGVMIIKRRIGNKEKNAKNINLMAFRTNNDGFTNGLFISMTPPITKANQNGCRNMDRCFTLKTLRLQNLVRKTLTNRPLSFLKHTRRTSVYRNTNKLLAKISKKKCHTQYGYGIDTLLLRCAVTVLQAPQK